MYKKQKDIGTGHEIRLTPKKAKTEHSLRQVLSKTRDDVEKNLVDKIASLDPERVGEAYKMVAASFGIQIEPDSEGSVVEEGSNGQPAANEGSLEDEEVPRLFSEEDDCT